MRIWHIVFNKLPRDSFAEQEILHTLGYPDYPNTIIERLEDGVLRRYRFISDDWGNAVSVFQEVKA